MSYAGPARSGGSSRGSSPSGPPGSRPSHSAPRPSGGEPGDEGTDWQTLSLFGAGLALGIAVGASVALMTAPRTGAETRAVLRSRAGRLRRTTSRRGRDSWDDLRDELLKARSALRRRKLRRLARKELEREAALD